MFITSLKSHSAFSIALIFLIGIFLTTGCDMRDSNPASYTPVVTPQIRTSQDQISNPTPQDDSSSTLEKWDLWVGAAQLRGANIWQRIVIPDLDGVEFLGSDYIGPPYSQKDFNRLAALGANYVNISGPGLFTEEPPYQLDLQVQAHLDQLLDMIQKADLFAVITFRTGPGRSDFTFYRDGAGDWFDPDLLREWVWTDQAAQDAWVEMWRYTASRYQGHSVVVGYDLMCEPNAAGIRDIWEPEDFYHDYAGTTLDWNQLYPRITLAIRDVDLETPILIGGRVGAVSAGSPTWNLLVIQGLYILSTNTSPNRNIPIRKITTQKTATRVNLTWIGMEFQTLLTGNGLTIISF